MYSGGENLQMNGDTPHDGGHGGGGHGDCEELQRTGRSVTWSDAPSKAAAFPVRSRFTLSAFHADTGSCRWSVQAVPAVVVSWVRGDTRQNRKGQSPWEFLRVKYCLVCDCTRRTRLQVEPSSSPR